ncbi:MAG: hypothetical protein K2X52_16790 [Mycobacteriaceae bacterium]|nr:hypothetical protein [Mycobacteriaceae bacterium]
MTTTNAACFRGRWGQGVSTDSMSRRCGPKFPDYVDMFLRALEDGITRVLPAAVTERAAANPLHELAPR